jgi:hypothetical protein
LRRIATAKLLIVNCQLSIDLRLLLPGWYSNR